MLQIHWHILEDGVTCNFFDSLSKLFALLHLRVFFLVHWLERNLHCRNWSIEMADSDDNFGRGNLIKVVISNFGT